MKKYIVLAAALLLLPVSGVFYGEPQDSEEQTDTEYIAEYVDSQLEEAASAEGEAFSGEEAADGVPDALAPEAAGSETDTDFLAVHNDYAYEEEAPSPGSGLAPHIRIIRHANNDGMTVTDDGELTQWEREDCWVKMHEAMPSYCKPYLEDTPFTGARNVQENEISINFGHHFLCTVGYRHYYTYASIAGIEGSPEVCGESNGCYLLKYSLGDRTVSFLSDGERMMYLTAAPDKLYDVRRTDKGYAVLYGNSVRLYAQYIYPGGLEGKDLSYTYEAYTVQDPGAGKATPAPAEGRFLTDNVIRLEFGSGKVQHWKVKLSEGDLAHYDEQSFALEQEFRGIWKELRTKKRLLWTSDPVDPRVNVILPDYNSNAWDFDSDTSREPVYTE